MKRDGLMQGKDIGRYHILEQLGEGGMATVYKALDTHLEAEVAVKVIRIDELPPKTLARALKRFEREAKAVARLNHPNIVNITDYGEFEGQPYLVMPYLQGGTLKEKLQGKAMDWQDAAQMLIPIAKALGYAHQREMIHRDVKPANILITETGEPLLTDFGVAKIVDDEATMDLTGTHATVGTPEYMAPEQVTAKSVDHRADIYALGIVFYEMVTGRKPFQADTPMAVLFKHASEPLPRPTQFVPKLPKSVEQILLKALAKDPKNRYQSMAELASAMEFLQGGAGKNASKVRSPRKKKENVKRKKAPNQRKWVSLAKISFALIGVVLTGIFGLPALQSQPDKLPEPTQALAITSSPIEITDDFGVEMMLVPSGEFMMGSEDGNTNESPAHIVFQDEYFIDRYEVTNQEFAAFLNQAGNQNEGATPWLDERDEDVLIRSVDGSFHVQNIFKEHPVIEVTWYGAQAYCEWRGASLPTEAQWEKASRGDDGRIYPWGDDIDNSLANGSGSEDGFKKTATIGSFPGGVSPFGVEDMAGNVWEWTLSQYQDYPYADEDGRNDLNATGMRVLRGGSWIDRNDGIRFRSSYRSRDLPAISNNNFGFRCARDVPPTE